MECPNCHHDSIRDNNFCSNCGHPFVIIPDPNFPIIQRTLTQEEYRVHNNENVMEEIRDILLNTQRETREFNTKIIVYNIMTTFTAIIALLFTYTILGLTPGSGSIPSLAQGGQIILWLIALFLFILLVFEIFQPIYRWYRNQNMNQ